MYTVFILGCVMFVFTVNIYHEYGQLKSAAELLEAIKETAGTGPAMVSFLGAKSQRLFQSLIKKEPVSTPTKITEPARANEIINAKNISP